MEIMDLLDKGVFGPYERSSQNEVRIHCPHPERHEGGVDHNPSCYLNLQKLVYFCHTCGSGSHVNNILKYLGEGHVNLQSSNVHFEENAYAEKVIDPIVLNCWNYVPMMWVSEGFNRDVLSAHSIGYDFVNKRITVPIFNHLGELVAISGRTIHNKKYCKEHRIPRYKFYKYELLEYQPSNYNPKKGQYLWRQHMLPPDCREVIIVEGFKAAMWLVQNGITNVVATMGLAFTQAQVLLLLNMNAKYTILYDGEQGGIQSANKLAITLKSEGCSTRVVVIPDEKSPDDLSRSDLYEILYQS
tara:strand:+ start:892 stop:1791 length:900 start_codon:yes stop_codon:yes gene_type:complete